jgi:choline transporter-like protein 2/4/5
MKCGCCAKEEDDPNKIVKSFTERKPTDVLCVIFFVFFWMGMFIIAGVAVESGSVDPLLYPTDYLGQSCGKPGSTMEKTPVAYMPRLGLDVLEQSAYITGGLWWKFRPYIICTEECPGVFTLDDPQLFGGPTYPGASPDAKVYYSGFPTYKIQKYCFPYQDTEPGDLTEICAKPFCNETAVASLGVRCGAVPDVETKTAWVIKTSAQKEACLFKIDKRDISTFQPAGYDDEAEALTAQLTTLFTGVFAMFSAVSNAFTEIAIFGGVLPFVLGFIWMLFLRFFAGIVVTLLLMGLVAFLIFSTAYLWVKSGSIADVAAYAKVNASIVVDATAAYASTEDNTTGYLVAAVIMTFVTLITIICLIMWRKAIKRCIAIIKESCKVFKDMPLLMAYPLNTIFALMSLFAYFLAIGAYIASSAPKSYADATGLAEDYEYTSGIVPDLDTYSDKDVRTFMACYHIFGFLWTAEFFQSFAFICMAGGVGYWYFSRIGADAGGLPKQKLPLINSTKKVFLFHGGSAIFGALIIAVFQAIRLALLALDKHTQKLQEKNFLFKVAIKCVQCLMWCFQKTVEFISYYAYIYVALDGSSFCSSAWETFKLILGNPAQTAVNKIVQTLISFMISLSIPVICGCACFLTLEGQGSTHPIYPTVFAFVMSAILAKAISGVFACTIDTIYICAFKDMAQPGGVKFMSDEMRDGFGLDKTDEAAPMHSTFNPDGTKKVRGEQAASSDDVDLKGA